MARQFGAESLGAAGYAVRGPVSAAAAAGCALIEVGGNQLGFSSAPPALLTGATFTGDVAINCIWTSNPGNTNAFTIRREVGGSATITDNTPLMRMEHIANSQFPYAGFRMDHNTTVPGGNPGGSYISMSGPTNAFGLQFDYLAGAGTPNYQGDVRYMLTGAQSKHIFQVNTGAAAAEVGRFDTNGLTAASIRSGGTGLKLGGTADIEFAPTNVDAATDALIIRNATGQIDVRANSGVRFRNLANAADAPITAGAGTFSGLITANGGISVNGGTLSIGGGNGFLVWQSPNLDVRADNGLRIRNLANSADAALTALELTAQRVFLTDAAKDVFLVRSNSGLLDVRGDSGLRIRNFGNTGWGTLTVGAVLPGANDSFDLGSSSLGWRTLFLTDNIRTQNANGVAFRNLANSDFAPIFGRTITTTTASGTFAGDAILFRLGGDPAGATWSAKFGAKVGAGQTASWVFDTVTMGVSYPNNLILDRGKVGIGYTPTTGDYLPAAFAVVGSGVFSGTLQLGAFTVATLPSASANPRAEANVTDSSVTTFGATVAGGGSSNVKVRSNGTNWTVCGI